MLVPETSRTEGGLATDEIVAERYCVKRRLGAGGMGEAYLAEDLVLHRRLVLKRLSRTAQLEHAKTAQLITEAKRATAIDSPHIAQVFDVCNHHGEWLLAMEYVAGSDLRALLAAPLSPERFFALSLQLVEAIQAAHAGGILHCDIKPENIMVTEQGFVKVLDFGLAQMMASPGREHDTMSLADAGSAFSGTPGYMAPEVLRESSASEQSDIFSLGVVLYEMAGGKAPFKGKSLADCVQMTLTVEPPPLNLRAHGLPEELNRILQKTLMKQPERRYATVRDLLVDLRAVQQQFFASGSGPAHLSDLSRRFARTPSSGKTFPRRLIYACAALAVTVFAVAGVLLLRRRSSVVSAPAAAISQPAKTRLLAVIPFRLIGRDDAGLNAYSEGLREAITSSLARAAPSDSIDVLAASEVRAHDLSTPEEAHKELGADLVIDGSYQQYKNQVRIVYSLIDTTGRILHSDSVTSKLTDPFALEDSVVKGVLSMLSVSTEQLDQLPTQFGTQVSAAYDAYLHGLGYLRDFENTDNLKSALESFEQAVQADPDFAAAYAGLGEAHWALYQATSNTSQIALARASCGKGLTLNEAIAEVHLCLGTIDAGTGRPAAAEQEFVRAREIDPQSDRALSGLAKTYEQTGRTSEAEHVYQEAIGARPHYWANYYALANFLVRQARYSEAATVLAGAYKQFPANSFVARRLGVVFFLEGKFDQAAAMLERALAQRPHAEAYIDLGQVYVHQRKFGPAVTAFEEAARRGPGNFATEADLADAYDWSGMQKQKVDAVYRQARDLSLEKLKVDPRNLDALMVTAYTSAALGDEQQALASLALAIQRAPQDAEVNYYAARVYARLGNRSAVKEWLAKASARGYSRADIDTAPDFAGYPGKN